MSLDWYSVLRRINLNQIVTFLIVAEEGSFRSAALRMHVSQSAVSVQVRQLEEALGLKLFNRTTRLVTLTPGGRSLLVVARRVTADMVDVASTFREEADFQRGLVTIAALQSHAANFLPRVMRDFREVHPLPQEDAVKVGLVGAIGTLGPGAGVGIVVEHTRYSPARE